MASVPVRESAVASVIVFTVMVVSFALDTTPQPPDISINFLYFSAMKSAKLFTSRKAAMLRVSGKGSPDPRGDAWRLLTSIAVVRALNSHVDCVFDSSPKDKNWRRRKLRQDM
jgi:hypothetical protein